MPPLSGVYPEPRTPKTWWQSPPKTPLLTAPAATPSPGSWRHPKIQDIAKRQYASTFSTSNFQRALWNSVAFLLSFVFLDDWIAQCVTFFGYWLDIGLAPLLFIWAFRLFFLANIAFAIYPLFATIDPIDDIPLTDRQRALLGLSPSSTPTPPHTPESNFVTPPKYRRSAASPSQRTPSSSRSSPLNPSTQRSNSPSSFMSAQQRPRSNSPFDGSPLSQKAARSGSRERTSLYGSPLQGGRSVSLGPSTPSPIGRARNGNINYKWLYEKGGRLPRSDSGF
ncbi:MAG: hypothetical protein Q9160_003144 [Pyrenula sp. 1 TL-2023]